MTSIVSQEDRRLWDKLDNETPKAYTAFSMWILLNDTDLDSKEHRTINNLTRKMGYSDSKMLREWRKKYNWDARTKAYDMAVGAKIVDKGVTSLETYQRFVLQKTSDMLAELFTLLREQMRLQRDKSIRGEEISLKDLSTMVGIFEKIDTSARRLAGLPTNFTTVQAPARIDDKDEVFIIGEVDHGSVENEQE